MNICIFSHMYPNEYSSSDFVFVKKLVDEFSNQGHRCYVISPFNVMHYRHIVSSRYSYKVGETEVTVLRPPYISFGKNKISSVVSKYSSKLAHKIAFHMMKKDGFKPDVVYCHFWSSGLQAYPFAKKSNLPLFVASGESKIDLTNSDGRYKEFCEYVKGVICVSTKNKNESCEKKLTTPDKCIVAPNAINGEIFHKMDKDDCRKRLNLPTDKFILAFVGWFIERKGPIRVAEAINSIDSDDIYSLFIGSGEQNPDCKNILFKGKVDNSELPVYLNSADVFVLPTLHEGCCNAVIEALSCGLPVISSNLPFNWDVLNDKNSIMIDPNNVEEIKQAMIKIKDELPLRESMAEEAHSSAKDLIIDRRVKKILDFIMPE